MHEPIEVRVLADGDAHTVRRAARAAAAAAGFDPVRVEQVVLAAGELATNLARYARGGVVRVSVLDDADRLGVEVASRDDGPGIADLARAMSDGYSTSGGMGSGLPGARRLMDEFTIESTPAGTRVVARKWLPRR